MGYKRIVEDYNYEIIDDISDVPYNSNRLNTFEVKCTLPNKDLESVTETYLHDEADSIHSFLEKVFKSVVYLRAEKRKGICITYRKSITSDFPKDYDFGKYYDRIGMNVAKNNGKYDEYYGMLYGIMKTFDRFVTNSGIEYEYNRDSDVGGRTDYTMNYRYAREGIPYTITIYGILSKDRLYYLNLGCTISRMTLKNIKKLLED